MAKVKYRAAATAVRTLKFKTGASGGGFGTDPTSVPSGSCLTLTAAGEVGLAGAGDSIDYFLDNAKASGYCTVFGDNAYEIEGILTNGTLNVGDILVGYSDSDRGKAVAFDPAYATDATPTVQELKAAIELAMKAGWKVESASAGKANVKPRP